MGFQGGHVAVDLVEVETVLVLLILQNVEAHAAGLVALGADRVVLDRCEEFLALVWLDLDRHEDGVH